LYISSQTTDAFEGTFALQGQTAGTLAASVLLAFRF
jgi:hypothetical protein